jgi:uncharacterized protein
VTKAEAMAAALNEFLDVSWEVEAAAVVSPDGLPMASALPPDVEEDRLAAMSASLLTLGERAAEGLDKGHLAQVLVEGERGYVLLMSAGPDALLVAVMSRDAKVGLVLFEMKRAAANIARVMDGSYRQSTTAAGDDQGEDSALEAPDTTDTGAEEAFPFSAEASRGDESVIGESGPPPPPVSEEAAAGSAPAASGYGEPSAAWDEPVEDLRVERSTPETSWSEPVDRSQEQESWTPTQATSEPSSWGSSGETSPSQAPSWVPPTSDIGEREESPVWRSDADNQPPGTSANSDEETSGLGEESRSLWGQPARGESAADEEGEADPAGEGAQQPGRGWRHWRSSRSGEVAESEDPPSRPLEWLEPSEPRDENESPTSTSTWK